MKNRSLLSLTVLFLASIFFLPFVSHSEDYTLQYEVISNSAEADLIVRYGDIDNMGFGWPDGFDLFSGESTPAHSYPWQTNPNDAKGTDCIMVVSSYEAGSPPCGQDGYTSNTSRPANNPQLIQIPLPGINSSVISPTLFQKIVMQIFVDDFQAKVWCGNYEVTINGMRVPELEQIINSLNQTGPIGKLITFQLPDYLLSSVKNGNSLDVFFDDTTTGAGDGFAFDFFRILFNPKESSLQTGTVTGNVYDANTNQSIANAKVSINAMLETTTDSSGFFELTGVPAGIAGVTVTVTGYESQTQTVDVIKDNTSSVNFYMLESTTDPCALTDSDGDGVIDQWDHCPDTPADSYVDRYGCPSGNSDPCNEDKILERINEAYNNGYEEGKKTCDNGNPNQCEESVLGQDLILHIPMIKYQVPLLDAVYIWVDMEFIPMDDSEIYFKLIDYGIVQ